MFAIFYLDIFARCVLFFFGVDGLLCLERLDGNEVVWMDGWMIIGWALLEYTIHGFFEVLSMGDGNIRTFNLCILFVLIRDVFCCRVSICMFSVLRHKLCCLKLPKPGIWRTKIDENVCRLHVELWRGVGRLVI